MTSGQGTTKERGKRPRIPHVGMLHSVLEYGILAVGALCMALSFNLFLMPNQIASGGVSGISILLQHYWGWEPAFTQWAFNIPLFIVGFFLLGRQATWKTLAGTLLLPLFIYLTRELRPLVDDALLASIFGGMATGIGLGIVFRSRGTTGGLSVAAKVINKYAGVTLGLATAMLDGLVILAAGFVFTPEKALYALLGLYVTSKMIDVVQLGFSYSKVAFIISDEKERIEAAILHELDRGLTKLPGYGGYTGQEKQVYMVVIGQTEVIRLKRLVVEADPGAFIIISNTHEVLGEGFKLEKND